MQQTKLIELLRCFGEEEIKQFDLFLQSPYFNSSEKLIKFYRLISPYFPDFISGKLDKEKVYAKLHGKSIYNDQTMRQLTSALYQQARQFMAVEQLKSNAPGVNTQRILWLAERNVARLLEQELEQADKTLAAHTLHNADYYYHRWQTDFYKFSQYVTSQREFEHKLNKGAGLTTHVESLNRFYVISFFNMYIYLLSFSKIVNLQLSATLAEQIGPLALKYTGQGDIVIDTYYNIFQLLTTDDERYYFALKNILMADDNRLPYMLKTEISVDLENYCGKRLRQGDEQFNAEALEIFQFGLSKGIAFENGVLPYIYYQNVVRSGIETGKLAWTEKFADEYRLHLAAEKREEVYNLARANIMFAKKKFKEALRMVLGANTTIIYSRLDTKSLIARCQFELGMFEQLDILLDSYRHALEDENISEIRKKSNLLFVEAMRMLSSAAQTGKLSSNKKLQGFINAEKSLPHKRWFMDKLAG